MNTQLKDRPSTETVPESQVFSRPQPIWTDTKTPAGDPSPDRKRTWAIIAVAAALAAAIAAGVALTGDGATDIPTPGVSTERPAFDSPGGNSLNTQAPQPQAQLERAAFDSPGGNSLNTQAPQPQAQLERPAFDSPGGNSLN